MDGSSVGGVNKVDAQTRCLRCGRALRAARSIRASYGPVCRARILAARLTEALRDFTAAQAGKARELIADGGLVPSGRPGVFRAVSSRGDESYLAHSAACNCPGGLRSSRLCYHVLAVRLVMASRVRAA